MAIFESQRAAKEYLVARLVAEADREGKPLSEVERKMLYFSETDWTLPDIMEVNAEFQRNYDNDEYERKICNFWQAIQSHLKSASAEECDKWYAAIQKLTEGDHYLLVLLNPLIAAGTVPERPPGDLLKLWGTALAIVFGALGLMLLYQRFFGSH